MTPDCPIGVAPSAFVQRSGPEARRPRLAVVIPSFRAADTIAAVLRSIGPEVGRIYVVDDFCPEGTGERVRSHAADQRIVILRNERNLGVGGAMKRGYRQALEDGAEIVVKLDADGQMDPRHITWLIAPILSGEADYSKGNRFAPPGLMPPGSSPGALGEMPLRRRLANQALAVVHKVATGYWRVADPANGYTAIRRQALEAIEVDALADCFFFETDMLFRLNLVDAVVAEVPLPARYRGGPTTLSLRRVAMRFAGLTVDRCLRRLRTKYFSDAWNLGSLKLIAAVGAIVAACALAGWRWYHGEGARLFSYAEWWCLCGGIALLAAAMRYDARRLAETPLYRRDIRS